MSRRYAFATLVTSDNYLPGALTVAAALKEVHPSPPVDPEVPFQTVCIVTPETVDVKTIKHLRRAFDEVIGVEVIDGQSSAELQLLGRPDLHSVLTKLHVFRLTQFDKIIFLDADVLPFRPLSHLFTLPHEFSAVPDVGWPDIFNSGVMVFSPGEDKFNEVMGVVKTKGSWDGGDQGVLNEWRGSNWNRLSFTYNTTPTAAYTYPPAYERFGSQISAIHFIGPNKPWNELPYRAPSSAFQVLHAQHQLSQSQQQGISQQAISIGQTQTSATPQQLYAYSSLVDRWFDVYDRNYRQLIPAAEHEYEARKYENVWNENASTQSETPQVGALGLEELRKLALEGGASSSRQKGEGEYHNLPLEGRIDLMRPKQELPQERALPELHLESGPSWTSIPSEDHVRTPTMEQPQWLGQVAPDSDRQHVSTPGPNEAPPSPYLAPLSLPPSSSATPAPTSRDFSSLQEGGLGHFAGQSQNVTAQPTVNLSPTSSHPGLPQHGTETQSSQIVHQTQDQQHPSPGEPRRPVSPPLISWNPAIEPPPNVPPTPSSFPSDAYFPNAWDMPQSSGKAHDAGSTATSSQFFELPPQAHIPQQLLSEGHYRNVTGPHQERSPQPDISKVSSVFPWERKPRHMPGRVFPEGEAAPPGAQYIENMPPIEAEQESELMTPELTHDEKMQITSPQIQSLSPPIGFPGARGFANAWDSVPSIQKYAARLVKPTVTALPLTLPAPRVRKRADSYRSRGEQSDANSMDGDVEDEVDDDDSDVAAGGRFSSSERSTGGGSRRGSKASLVSPPSGSLRLRAGQKEYRSYGVQTVPKEVRSVAVQVSQAFSTSTGKSGGKNAPKPGSAATSTGGKPFIELPKQPAMQELHLGPEPTALTTPSSANVESFMRAPSDRQQHGLPSGIVSPRMHEAYTVRSPIRSPPNASPGTRSPATRRQIETVRPPKLFTEPPLSFPHAVVRTSSQDTADSPLGPASPVDIPSTSQPKKPAGRKWNPATGVDVFKRSSEEVLARFLRLGSWEDDSQPSVHTHG